MGSPSSSGSYGSLGGSGTQLASVVDDIMDVNDCQVYTFHPSLDADPHATTDVDTDEMGPEPLGLGSEYDDLGSDTEQWAHPAPHHSLNTPSFVTGRRPKPQHHTHTTKHSTHNGSRPPPPRPRRTSRASGGNDDDELVFDEDYDTGFNHDRRANSPLSSDASDSDGAEDDDDDDDDDDNNDDDNDDEVYVPELGTTDGMGGVLWTTYAFFYNRRLKRLLFVNVWARRMFDAPLLSGSHTAPAPAPATYTFPYARRASVEASATQPNTSTKSAHVGHVGATPAPAPAPAPVRHHPVSLASAGQALAQARAPGEGHQPTPVRRALDRSYNRQASRSPGPSAHSPFPHDSPHNSPSVLRTQVLPDV